MAEEPTVKPAGVQSPAVVEEPTVKAGVQLPGKEIITKEYAGVQFLAVKPAGVQSPAHPAILWLFNL